MVITGACSFGTKGFVETIEPKEEYLIEDLIELTKGQFGNKEFENFFK